ncbi:MAG: nicotinate-nucleotide adenylyltransferase [Ectothiorhodospiraceae bacterium]|nr:nicotinate-nucleotide adenylyltransferase [Ectothiorhodospiraceae bacterium]
MGTLTGIFGGTFDPVHNAHLRVALDVVEAGALVELRLIPCHIPPHRESPAVDAATRLHMLRMAVRGEPRFVVDDRELRRDTPSWTVDTLRTLRADFPDRHFCLLMGSDSFRGLPTWSRWRELGEFAHIVVMQRPDPGRPVPDALAEWLRGREADGWGALRRERSGRVLFQPVAQLAISATDIRERLARGGSIRYLVPDAVWDHIQQEGLYLTPS